MKWGLLGAMVCAAMLLGAATAAVADPGPVASNSMVRDAATGDEWIFAVDSAHDVQGFEYTPTTEAWTRLPLPSGAPAAEGTQPIAVRNDTSAGPDPQGHIAVFYSGSDGRMWTDTFSPATGWSAYPLPGNGAAPAAGTTPSVVYAPAGTGPNPPGFTAVYYAGADGHMWNYNFTPSSGWNAYALPGGGPPSAPRSSPVAVVNLTTGAPQPQGFEAVYYIADNGQVWNYNWTPSTGWTAYALSGNGAQPAPDTSPTVVYAPQGTGANPAGFSAVYYAGVDGRMWNYNWTPSTGWEAYALPGGGPTPAAAASPSVVVNANQGAANPAGFEAVYYVADDGQMWNYNWTPSTSWTAYQLGDATAAPEPITPVTLYDPVGGLSRVYFPAASGLEDVWTYANGWMLSGAFPLSAPAAANSPVATPLPLPPPARHGARVRVQIIVSWTWHRTSTVIRWVRIRRFPRAGTLAIRCLGRGCPRIRAAVKARHVAALLRSLRGRRFRAGDRIRITVSVPHKIPERIELQVRDARKPSARLL